MDFDSSFADVLARLHAGDEAAAAEIFSRYYQRLIAVASTRLGGAMRRKVDAEDLAQSALKSFFRAEAEGGLSLDSWSDLWALLTTITLRKCGHQVRQFMTGKRNINLESPLDGDSVASWKALAREPTPAEAAIMSGTVDEILAGLEGRPRQIVELTLQGLSVPEVSREVGLTERCSGNWNGSRASWPPGAAIKAGNEEAHDTSGCRAITGAGGRPAALR